jgi:hypothetical protein
MVGLHLIITLVGVVGCLAHFSSRPTAASASVSGHSIQYQFPKWQNCSCTSQALTETQIVTETKTVFMNYTADCLPPSTVYLPVMVTDADLARQQTVEVVSTSYITPSIPGGVFPFAVVSGTTSWLRGAPPTNAAVVWNTNPSTITVVPTVVTNVALVSNTPMSKSEPDEVIVITSTSYNFITVALASTPTESALVAETSSIDCAAEGVTCTVTVTKIRSEVAPTAGPPDNTVSSEDRTTTVPRTLTDTQTRTVTKTRRRSKTSTSGQNTAVVGGETVLASTLAIPSASSTPTSSISLNTYNSSSETSTSSAETVTSSSNSNSLSVPQVSSSAQGSQVVPSNSSATSEIVSFTSGIEIAPVNTSTTYSSSTNSSPVPSTRNFYPNTTSMVATTQSDTQSVTEVAADSLVTSMASSSTSLELSATSSNTSIQSTAYPNQYGAAPLPSVSASPSTTSASDTFSAPLASSLASQQGPLPEDENDMPTTVTVYNVTATNTLTAYETHPVSVYVMAPASSSSSAVLLITESPPAPSFTLFNEIDGTATAAPPSTFQTAVRRARLL